VNRCGLPRRLKLVGGSEPNDASRDRRPAVSGALTKGFDVVVQLTEQAINDGLEMLPGPNGYPPGTFPLMAVRPIPLTVAGIQVPYVTTLELERPRVGFDANAQTVTVTCDLGPSTELSLVQPAPVAPGLVLFSQVPLAGLVQFTAALQMRQASTSWPGGPVTGRAAVARLGGVGGPAPVFAIAAPQTQVGTLANVATTVAQAALQSALAAAFANLAALIGDLPVITPLPLHSGPNPVRRLQDVQARILTPPAGERPALGIGVISEATSAANIPTNINALTQTPGLPGGTVNIANLWLVRLVCATIQASPGFGSVGFTITANPPRGTFQGSAHIDPPSGDSFTLKRMTVEVDGVNGIKLSGGGSASGFCWDADFDFHGTLAFSCDPATGALTADLKEPLSVSADADISWYCAVIVGIVLGAIVGLIVGAVAGWIVGLIVGVIVAIVTAIVVANLDLGDPNLASIASLPGLFAGLGLPLPLPVGSPGLQIVDCQFDDLGVRGTPLYVDLAARQASGHELVRAGTAFDLDAGTWSSLFLVAPPVADLAWDGTTLTAVNGAHLQIVDRPFARLTSSDLHALSYPATTIAGAQMPVFIMPNWWFPPLGPLFLGPGLVFGCRTGDARYAKCSVWKELGGSRMFLAFETYAGPSFTLSLEVFLDTSAQTVVEQGEESCLRDFVRPVPFGVDDFLRQLNGVGGKPAPPDLPPEPHPIFARVAIGRPSVLLPGPLFPKVDRECAGDEIVHAGDRALWVRVSRAQSITVRAMPSAFDAPISYRWTVLGTGMPPGSGTLVVNGVSIAYDETSPYALLTAPQGADVVGDVCVTATDASGRHCQKCVALNQPGTVRLGGCDPCGTPTRLHDFYREFPAEDRRRAVAAAATLRLKTLVAPIQVQTEAPVLVRDAVRNARRGARPAPIRERTRAVQRIRRR
jgi:hypothetical protein